MRDRPGPPGTTLVPCLDGARAAAGYRVGAELAAEPAGELAQLPPAGSGGGVAWRALCCGWLRG